MCVCSIIVCMHAQHHAHVRNVMHVHNIMHVRNIMCVYLCNIIVRVWLHCHALRVCNIMRVLKGPKHHHMCATPHVF